MDGAYVIEIDEHKLMGTYWIPLYMNDNNVTYCDRFLVEYISKKQKVIGNKKLKQVFIEYKPMIR